MSKENAGTKIAPPQAQIPIQPKKRPMPEEAEKKTVTEPPKKVVKSEHEKEPEKDDKNKWKSLEHHGVYFHELYEPYGAKIKIKGIEKALTKEQEEVCGWWAKIMETDFAAIPKVRENFLKSLKAVLNPKETPIEKLEDVDFKPLAEYWAKKDEERKNRSKEEKKSERDKRAELSDNFGYAIVDGRVERIGKYDAEPPGIFRGRGDHPLIGTLKQRIWPDDVTINISEDVAPPKCQMPGMAWNQVIHRHEAMWLAHYKANTEQNHSKYVQLDATSTFKTENDKKKYEKARKLKEFIGIIRKDYMAKMKDPKSVLNNQLGTATYLIDKLALRVGNEKDENEADTVGCCSLRVEHIAFPEENTITLEFLAKDSMKYKNTVVIDENAYKNLKKFVVGKKPKDDLFDQIDAGRLNDYLKSLMPKLSAKVFRTYNASITLQNELNKFSEKELKTVDDKLTFYNAANRQVAILCNHQRSVPKGHEENIKRMEDQLKEKLQQQRALENHLDYLNGGKKAKKEKIEEGAEEKEFKLPKTVEQTEKAIQRIEKTINSMQNKLNTKEANKEVALGTSKINYMDPRITISWCKDREVPIEKIFQKTLRSKFSWAMHIEPTWQF